MRKKSKQMNIIKSSNNPKVDVLRPAQKLQVWNTYIPAVSVYVQSRTNPGIYSPGERARIKSRLRRADLKLSTESACTMLSVRWFHLITLSMKRDPETDLFENCPRYSTSNYLSRFFQQYLNTGSHLIVWP